jgi:hypothetical protein
VVVEGRDPVTNLWHRKAWAFVAKEGLISKVFSTTSRGLPSPEARGKGEISRERPPGSAAEPGVEPDGPSARGVTPRRWPDKA